MNDGSLPCSKAKLRLVLQRGHGCILQSQSDRAERQREIDGGLLGLVSINMLNNPAVFVSWLSHRNM